MSTRRMTPAQRGELGRRIGILAEAGLTEREAAKTLGIPCARYGAVQRLAGVWHALEAARMRQAEAAWCRGRAADTTTRRATSEARAEGA